MIKELDNQDKSPHVNISETGEVSGDTGGSADASEYPREHLE
jgi:hypothetical protein